MSAEGIRSAQWIARVQPQKAAVLAAELRNAVTPAALAANEMDTDFVECAVCSSPVGGEHDCPVVAVQELVDSIRDTMAHVLRIADALQGSRPELPTVPEETEAKP